MSDFAALAAKAAEEKPVEEPAVAAAAEDDEDAPVAEVRYIAIYNAYEYEYI
jgi:hypothetical protein